MSEHPKLKALADPDGAWTVQRASEWLRSYGEQLLAYRQRELERAEARNAQARGMKSIKEPDALELPAPLPESIKQPDQLSRFNHAAMAAQSANNVSAYVTEAYAHIMGDPGAMQQIEAIKAERGLNVSQAAFEYGLTHEGDTFSIPLSEMLGYLDPDSPNALPGVRGITGPESFGQWADTMANHPALLERIAPAWSDVKRIAIERGYLVESAAGLVYGSTRERWSDPYAISQRVAELSIDHELQQAEK